MTAKILFALGLLLAAIGVLSPPAALAAGMVFALVFTHPFDLQSKHWSKILL